MFVAAVPLSLCNFATILDLKGYNLLPDIELYKVYNNNE